MSYVHVPTELWTTSLMPEGILERWLVEDGSTVAAGQALAWNRPWSLHRRQSASGLPQPSVPRYAADQTPLARRLPAVQPGQSLEAEMQPQCLVQFGNQCRR